MLSILRSKPKLLISSLLMIPGGALAGLFGVTGYLVFFFICIPITYSVLKSIVQENGLAVTEKRHLFIAKLLIFATISYAAFASLLALTVGLYLPKSPDLSEHLIIVYILLLLCLFPILYYVYLILPKSLTTKFTAISLFPSGLATAFGYILTFTFFSIQQDQYSIEITPAVVMLTILVLYFVAPILYIKTFKETLSVIQVEHNAQKEFLKQFLVISILGFLIFMSVYSFSGTNQLEYPSCC